MNRLFIGLFSVLIFLMASVYAESGKSIPFIPEQPGNIALGDTVEIVSKKLDTKILKFYSYNNDEFSIYFVPRFFLTYDYNCLMTCNFYKNKLIVIGISFSIYCNDLYELSNYFEKHLTKPYGKPISSREIKKKNSKTEFTIESRWNHQNTNISLECDNSPKELLGFSIVGINWFHLDNPWSKFRKSNQFDDTKAEINSEVIELAFNCCQKIIDEKQAYPRISLVPVPVLRTGQ